MRPALAVLSAEAAGADATVGVPGAVAVELVHNFSLLHDDIMDGDRERRHRPTVWASTASATPSSSATPCSRSATRSCSTTRQAGGGRQRRAGRRLAAMIGGQADDMAFEGRSDVTGDECVGMVAGKTGALLSCAAAIGAVLVGAPAPVVAALGSYGAHLGVAFQAVDDMLGIWGDPERDRQAGGQRPAPPARSRSRWSSP